jgi:hypothetical protein
VLHHLRQLCIVQHFLRMRDVEKVVGDVVAHFFPAFFPVSILDAN